MLEAPKNVEVDFIVNIYKDMEMADEIETSDGFGTYKEALEFYKEQRQELNDKVFIELVMRTETTIDDTQEETEENTLADNYNYN